MSVRSESAGWQMMLLANRTRRPAAPWSVLRAVLARFLVATGALWLGLLLGGVAPYAFAAPDIPDVDSLIDDSGPLPGGSDSSWARDLMFATPSGITCEKTMFKVAWAVICGGDFPGAPPGTRTVTLDAVAGTSNLPAQFRTYPPEHYFAGAPSPVLLPVGHKMVFYAYSNDQTLVCGVPLSADLACILRSGPETHGFVIAHPQSQAF